jgi:hypothetical protein
MSVRPARVIVICETPFQLDDDLMTIFMISIVLYLVLYHRRVVRLFIIREIKEIEYCFSYCILFPSLWRAKNENNVGVKSCRTLSIFQPLVIHQPLFRTEIIFEAALNRAGNTLVQASNSRQA